MALMGMMGVSTAAHANTQPLPDHVYSIILDSNDYDENDRLIQDQVIEKFRGTHPDQYDFIVFYGTTATQRSGDFGAFFPIVKSAENIGHEFFGPHPSLSTDARLHGAVFLHGLDKHTDTQLVGLSLHEISHDWLAYISHISDKPFVDFHGGNDGVHWSQCVDTSTMHDGVRFLSPNGGAAWDELSEGSFLRVLQGIFGETTPLKFHPIELYLMGFLTPESTIPFSILIPDAEQSSEVVTGRREFVTVYDIINTYGLRTPSANDAQTAFSIAFVLLEQEGHPSSAEFMRRVINLSQYVPAQWYRATDGLSSINGITADLATPPNRTLIKLENDGNPLTTHDTAVYLVENGKRRPFLNERLYFLRYSTFENIQEIGPERMATLPVGAPVLPPPNTWVKIQSVPKVYVVQGDGVTIRWIPTEETAQELRGEDWNRNIETIDVVLYGQFTIGTSIDEFQNG